MIHEEKSDLIRELRAENERLATEHGKISDSRREWIEAAIAARHEIERLKAKYKNDFTIDVLEVVNLRSIVEEQNEDIERLKALLTRAADVLEVYLSTAAGGTRHPFIAELRKGAE